MISGKYIDNSNSYTNKTDTILVTGGAGSIGRILVRQLLDRNPEVIRILDRSEPRLARIKAVDST